ncbi:MAG TPA: type I-C CRISPR-associated endonuclease Cas1c [Kiritimatiellia bacterium]|nr:type I-C CRISPR-associated endonuclease Cas1c [Kiritimatiellia bacterium]HMO98726.1 type I-C CRISPR-associated endonuclease Cas1c [Kiritimatiellia bacterium]HMP96886.1 type I-C CRISPR-associated endonuclease Cas1c [Kiritimatiellia bacterium]
MKKFLNTLFVTTQGAYLNKEGESVIVSVEREVRLRVPVHTLGGIVCFGNVLCSPFLLGHCAENGVAVSMLTENGRFLTRVQGGVSGNVLLRREQYRRADEPAAALAIARSVVAAKIANARTVLQRGQRDHGDKKDDTVFLSAITRMERMLDEAAGCEQLESLRGKEGDAGREYFGVFDHLITTQKESFFMRERNRRPPLDNLNALLSFTYTLLAHDCVGALEAVGLDPQVGFLHKDRSGRPSLALDLMEEFRPYFADRLVLSLINLRQVQGKGFMRSESGAVEMDDETRKTLLVAYQKRKQEEIKHPYLDETMPVGLLFYAQALLLARHLRGDLDGYPPFFWK